MHRSLPSPPRLPPSIPDGWYSIHASVLEHPKSSSSRSVDGLGLAKGVHAANLRVPRLLANNSRDGTIVRSSPRHRRLQQTNQHIDAADAFAPNRSLRLASLEPRRDIEEPPATTQQQKRPRDDRRERDVSSTSSNAVLSARSRAARFRESRAPPIVPLHEVVRDFDDAVDASPLAESNQVAITGLFLDNWMERFERERGLYKSIVLHAEVAFRELYRLTAKLSTPSDVVTAFACKIFEDMVDHFGPYSTIVRVLSSEFRQSIYAPPTTTQPQPLPYYAIVKNQKRILISLRNDKMRRQERNDFLRYEIDKVHETLLHFLDQCGLGLVRTIFREWYFVAVVSKRNSKKYIEYFSAWFGGSAKALVPQLFLAWKSLAVETKAATLHAQLAADQNKLSGVQKQIEELTVQRNLAQLESLAIRNDRKHAEDTIQRLHRKIQSASAFLEDSERREALVAHESQLRVEAVTFLPPLVLESLLRGFHNVGFLQPLHNEFAPSIPPPKPGASEPKIKIDSSGGGGQVIVADESVLSQCISALHASIMSRELHSSSEDGAKDSHQPREISLNDCLNYVRGIKQSVEADPTAYLLFLPTKTDVVRTANDQHTIRRPQIGEDSEDLGTASTAQASPLGLQELVGQFLAALHDVRHQDEHYARHPKLFNSRMLEQSEISVVPHTVMTLQSDAVPTLEPSAIQRVPFSSIDNARVACRTGVFRASEVGHDGAGDTAARESLDQLPLVQAHDLELSPQHTRAFIIFILGQLLIEYGSLLFSPTDLSAFVRNRLLHKVMLRGISGGKHTMKNIQISDSATNGDGDDDCDDLSDDDDESSVADVGGDSMKGKRGGMAMLGKQTTQRRIQVVKRRRSSYLGLHAPIAYEIDRGLTHLTTAYNVWNRITQQLIQADIVAARGAITAPETAILPAAVPIDPKASVGSILGTSESSGALSPAVVSDKNSTSLVTLRPRLQVHIEPLPSGPLMASVKERDRADAPATPSAGHRRSMATFATTTEWSYDMSKVRLLALDDPQQLLDAVQGVYDVVHTSTRKRAVVFSEAKSSLRRVRAAQWQHACDLASQFSCTTSSDSADTIDPISELGTSAAVAEDDRRHVFECVSFENEAIERLFSVEDHPEDELLRVQAVLECKKHVVRHALYCKHRPGVPHAASLDDLWHIVKVLRLPRDVRVLPALRDDELVGTSYFHEHFFSPDDVAEVLLHLCNEQFLPHIIPLSARVEYFVTHHLPLAMQNQSAIRDIMHKPDVKKALSDHSHTLRTIFRRYCAKDKDLLAAAAAKRRAAVVAATATTAVSSVTTATNAAMYAASLNPTQALAVVSTGPQGIAKFMRLTDWHEFIADYKLLRARFTAEYATVVFCNVQEAESGLEDNLEMIFSEFTEAIVALSVCFFPDPFLRHATRVHQFIRRYLPVSPEETREHHI